jgi:hypothetical protein
MATDTAPRTTDDVPNWYDGPITMWAIVDRFGRPFAFDSERIANETLERWERTLKKFGPHRIIKLVEERDA